MSTRGGDPAWRDQAASRNGPTGEGGQGGPDHLLRKVARGDEKAFTTLYEILAPRVFGLARRVLRDPAQAEEVAQEALVEVWRTAARFDPAKGSATSWVLTITHRRAVDRVRSAQAGADRERRAVAASGETPYDDVVEAVTANLEQQQVRRCLKGLTDLQREAITLAYYDGFTYREVAEKLDTALPTIKTRMRDGLIRLRDCLGVEVGTPATTRAGSERAMSQPIEVHTLSGAYALDGLTEIERAGFERHVAECSVCATEVAEFRETATRLGVAAWETPPARLRGDVLAEVARTRQVTAGSRSDRAERGADVARWRRRTAAAVAAGLIAVGGGATAWVVQEQRVIAAASDAAELSNVLAAGDAQIHTGTSDKGGRITVAVSPSRHESVAIMSDMPALPKGKAYQLWLITGTSAPEPAGTMAAGATSGHALLPPLGRADQVAVTVEPAGGSTHPTTDVLIGVPLA